MQIDKVYFDMDGVLADFDRGIQELCGLSFIPQNEKTEEQDNEMWRRIRAIDHFYDKLQPMEGAVEMFREVYKTYGEKCEILTAVPKPHRGVATAGEDKIQWVHRLLGDDIVVHIVYAAQKKEFCKGPATVLIDDLDKNIASWRDSGGTGILYKGSSRVPEQLRILEADF